jgi:hypothetical protein
MAPRFVAGRRGGISVVDALVRVLWSDAKSSDSSQWPAKDFNTLALEASKVIGYRLSASTVRSAIYGHEELFDRASEHEQGLLWRLSLKARSA